LQSSPELVEGLMKTLTKEVKKTQIADNKNHCLLGLKELISRSRNFKEYEDVLKETIKLLKATNLKVLSSAYKCVRAFLSVFPSELLQTPYFTEILTILKSKLKEHDADRVVKYSVIKCIGPIFEHFLTSLKPSDES
jgi:hypothetical protein